ncbi:MAG: hypothetical protein LCH52_08340 [Bacteroidetes bacterium]|nr:hypothetical protein [Bacteroidota bacterium]
MSLFSRLFKSKKFDKAKNFQQFLFDNVNSESISQAGTTNEKGQVLKESSHPGWLRWQTPDLFSNTENKTGGKYKPAEKDLTQLKAEFEDTSPKDLFDRVDNHLTKKQELREFRDFNKRVPGSRKELAAIKKLTARELLHEDSITQYEYIKKDILIPPFNAEEHQKNGDTAGLVYLKMKLRDSIALRPKHEDKARKIFVELLPEVIKSIDHAKGFGELSRIFSKYFVKSIRLHNGQMRDDVFFSQETLTLLESKGIDTHEEMLTASQVFGDRFFPLLRQSTIASKRQWKFAQHLTAENDWSLLIDTGTINDGNETELNKDREKSLLKQFPKLDRVIRKNGREVTDEEINPENLHNEFGYNAVVFGNYMDNESAREHVKFFVGAMKDLEDVLGINLPELNRKGRLNIAFGAFGGGGTHSNYKPLKTLINVTKSRGDGSVAHEWGNFLNHFLAGARTDVTDKTAFATESIAKLEAIRKPLKAIINEISNPENKWYKNSSVLKSGLFKKTHEMFARAFESFVQDELKKKEMYNNYLVTDNRSEDTTSIYPQGKERDQINKLFTQLFQTIAEVYDIGKSSDINSKRVNEDVGYANTNENPTLFSKSLSIGQKIGFRMTGLLRKAKKIPKNPDSFHTPGKPEDDIEFSKDQLFDGMKKNGKRLEPSYKNPQVRRFHKIKDDQNEKPLGEVSPDLFHRHHDGINKPNNPNTVESEYNKKDSEKIHEIEIELNKILLPFKKLAESEPLELEENILELNPAELKALAYESGKKLRGNYLNTDTGEVITVNRTSIKKVINHEIGDENHLLLVTSIPKIIERSIFIAEELNEKDRLKRRANSYKYFMCGMNIKGESYTIKSVITVMDDGERYYDHGLTKIEKGKLLSYLDNAVSSTLEFKNLPFNKIKDTRIFKIMQAKKEEILKLFLDLNKSIIESKVMNNQILRLKKSIGIVEKFFDYSQQSATYLDKFVGQDDYKPEVTGDDLKIDIQSILIKRFPFREVPEAAQGKEFAISKDFGTLNILVSSKGEIVIKFKDCVETWPDISKNDSGIYILKFYPWSEIAQAISVELGTSNKEITIADDLLQEIVNTRDSITKYHETIESNELTKQALDYLSKRENIYFSIDPEYRWVNFIDDDISPNLCNFIQNKLSAEIGVIIYDRGKNAILKKADPADNEWISFLGKDMFNKKMFFPSGRTTIGYSIEFLFREVENRKNKQSNSSFIEIDNKIYI